MRTLYFVTVLLVTIALTSCKKKSAGLFSASIVEDLVRNEVQKKMPSAAHTKTMTGVHLKEATDAINKLVDESIVDRVHEAEKEVSRMLLKSIEHHIQDAGKALLKTDEDTCKDRIEGCKELASSNVCETSKDAMIVNCPHTCNFCGMLSELKDQSKQQSQTQSEEPERKPKRKHKKRKHRRHKSARLTASEANMVHQSMLDQAIDNSNLPNAVASENQESVPQATAQAAQQAAPEDTQAQDAADAAAQQQEAEEAQKEQDEAELRKQQEEEEARKQEELEEEERQAEERRRKHRRRKKLLKQHQEQAALATPEKEDYFSLHCHPLCAKECISSCAPGCCDHRVPEITRKAKSKKRCHPMCKQVCLPSCGKDCCAPGVQPMPPPQAGMCPPGCPLACAPSCLDTCCGGGAPAAPAPVIQAPPPVIPMAPAQPAGCFGGCINSCEASCPAQCCPGYMDPGQICNAQCPASCAPACTPDCCGAVMPAMPPPPPPPPPQPPRKEEKRPATLPVAGPSPFDTCPGACPMSCAPGCDFDCCRPFLDPNIVQEMRSEVQPSSDTSNSPQPMTRVIHVSHVLRPEEPQIAQRASTNASPANCPSECKQHCSPSCAKDGCCTDKKKRKRKRSRIPHSPKIARVYEDIYDREMNMPDEEATTFYDFEPDY